MESLPKFLMCNNPLDKKSGTFIFHTEPPQLLAEVLRNQTSTRIQPVWAPPIPRVIDGSKTQDQIAESVKQEIKELLQEMREYFDEVDQKIGHTHFYPVTKP